MRVGLLSFVVGEEHGKEKDSGEAGEAGEEKTVEGKNKEEKDQEYVTGILLEDPDHSNDSHPNDGDAVLLKQSQSNPNMCLWHPNTWNN